MTLNDSNLKILSVCQVNQYIKMLIGKDEILSSICVKGEISNYKNHISGHLYFTLKDSTSIIKCVMFKDYAKKLNFKPQDGMKVIISGNINVFERDGQYQLYCSYMEPDGIGTLYMEFEKLKKKLFEEGLFDLDKKKSIPIYSKRIGVLTSSTGAVIRDIINVSTRRFPNIDILLYPVAVQGVNSAKEVVEGIELFNKLNNVDIIIVARGGGSLEELWSFNEEIVARAIFASEIPIVSAVGHETDFTISDMVADLRAPTPSAAAELIVPSLKELKWKLVTYSNKLENLVQNNLLTYTNKVKRLQKDIQIYNPKNLISQYSLILDNGSKNLNSNYKILINKKRHNLANLVTKLNSLNPLKILERGYTITNDEKGNIITSVLDMGLNEIINLHFKDGKAKCEVQELNIEL